MNKELIHVYMMPGMAAEPTIFNRINLPENQFQIHWLEWMIPEENESLESYAKRMIMKIEHENVVLLGVSFGGVLVQEMSKHIKVRKLIVVSSVKSKHELPKRMRIAKFFKAYKFAPTQLLSNLDVLKKYAFNEAISKRIDLYKTYLAVNDKRYLDWALKQMICWDQDQPIEGAIYIHGDKDAVFTHSCGGNCIVIKGGTHIMIIFKSKWFNENLPKLILDKY
ncbi:alpha/beta hydrolase [Subsaxibacter sp. CAU 1640]|uniref:alpha/beta fold hydrolase n=1 Tax=Subsaxibacter sp. CAU 1640 TaxID=2933271 RepID=UPI002005F0C4|nr:alpha/beta hydrolase [Subsaxibacter sp. CAU 1640]MCK7589948.1 alpha/beta hydrolase [Subsaxibacter sp. CAU 1640]